MGRDIESMTTHLVTFSDESMSRARDLCIESAIRHGVDENNVDPWSDGDFFTELPDYDGFLSTRPEDPRRAIGWWSWKPAIVDKNLNGSWCKDGDILIYADVGVEFLNNVNYIIDRMGHEKPQDDIWLFGNNWEHAHWCKRDVLDVLMPQSAQCPACHKWCGGAAKRMPCEAGYYYHPTIGKQVQASVIFFRVSDYTRQFVAEWLKWCLFEGGRLIDDSPSRAPNHPEFREHRHDQAILTTLAYREGIKIHAWPAVYNRFLGQEFIYSREGYPETDDYPPLFHHHRLRNGEFQSLGIKL
jgi:hypothetical protein